MYKQVLICMQVKKLKKKTFLYNRVIIYVYLLVAVPISNNKEVNFPDYLKFKVFVSDGFYIEADGWDCGDHLPRLQPVEDRSFTCKGHHGLTWTFKFFILY